METSDEPWTSVTPAASRLFFEPKASPSDAASNVAADYCWKETRMITPITASSYFQYSSRKILGHYPTSAQVGDVMSSSNIERGLYHSISILATKNRRVSARALPHAFAAPLSNSIWPLTFDKRKHQCFVSRKPILRS